MYKKILVPMALDHGVSEHTLEIAKSLSAGTGEIIALHVYEAPQGSVMAYLGEEAVKEGFQTAKGQLAAKTDGLDGVQAVIVKGHTYRTIIDYAAENGIDCIVIGSHKPGLSDFLLGSTAARVVRHAACAVHVHRSS
ncbi:universal stress protein [Pelagimonas varians]|uniref:Universal stress protein F n=1 Tax=Pelagimonas varians TaxID=696760 RepID=A0A238K200_9RHOB|nr:universal stress protein [Pelagimonas varians]PYG33200.1 nucleotide-binding universal stress UspA family protein [Pelagimonas varians]SMX35976.1 Universal stress protein F [Pelagimonas varians]